MKQESFPCSCITCKRQTSSLGIDTHYLRSHGSQCEKAIWGNTSAKATEIKNAKKTSYSKSPNKCKHCDLAIEYERRHNQFCSHSCAASSMNEARIINNWSMTTSTKERISNKLKNHNSFKNSIVGEFSKLVRCSCKFCKLKWIGPTRRLVCNNCNHLKWQNNKDRFSFKFNIFDYPDLFDLKQLQLIGWVAFGGKRGGVKNISGLSRDHKVSVSEAKQHNHNPYYISHPCNCELMPHSANNKKKANSSITYQELIKIVDEYDQKLGGLLR